MIPALKRVTNADRAAGDVRAAADAARGKAAAVVFVAVEIEKLWRRRR